MKSQAALLGVKQAVLYPESDLWRRAAVHPLADNEAPLAEHQVLCSDGRDFSEVPVDASGPDGVHAQGSWPLAPQRCSFGGACHTCPTDVQAKRDRGQAEDAPTQVPPIVHEVLRSPGRPLDAETRAFMELRFGHDFRHVRVHTGLLAAKSARAMDALAYTVGRDVVFGAEQYCSEMGAQRRLMAHELAHVVQQSSLPSGAALRIGHPGSVAEREADLVSDQIVRGGNAHQRLSRHTPGLYCQTVQAAQVQPAATRGTQVPETRKPVLQAPPITTIQNVKMRDVVRFDAELDRRAALDQKRRETGEPCRLTLTVKVKFNFTDTLTPSRWTPIEQKHWQDAFIHVVTNRWSFRFLLVPARLCPNEPTQLVAAILRIQPVTAGQHNTMKVLYDKPSDARSNVRKTRSTLYRSDVDRPGSDLRLYQATATHEAGHLLGVPHVRCDTNEDECYGTNREESADVMGRGEIVTERDYAPFVTALERITGCSWRVRDGQRGPLFGNVSTGLAIGLGIAGGIVAGVLTAVSPLAAVLVGALGAAVGAGIGYEVGRLFD
jgi:hypothetical protein